ncbi:epoxide hydrolase family protein [Chitinophaga sp. NPDC101104]|uniref:epoxide hydrolase family protein n=1 Tax=Chitinophaga sp. NPDC101104 TaxID=3390561 RepID=UPI003D02A135
MMAQPYPINIPPAVLEDLKSRLAKTIWPGELADAGWQYGASEAFLRYLCQYWQHEFDWEKQEAYLRTFSHFKTTIADSGIHFIHQKGAGKNSLPVLLIHGFPDSFVRFLKIIPLLTSADADGFSFDVVVPSIPGFGFSDKPVEPGMHPERIAGLFAKLMAEELGYTSFLVHGGDWGSTITEQIALKHPQLLKGIHLTDVPFRHLLNMPQEQLSPAETDYLSRGKQWQQQEGAYAAIQSTKPQSLAYGMTDSPAGLAAWIIEKFQSWSDCNGNLENSFTKDELLTNLTIYWATQTIPSALGIYYQAMHAPPSPFRKIDIPTAMAIFPKDLVPAPREYAEKVFAIEQWTQMPAGGHFTAMEQPELLADDLRKFAKTLR